MDYAYLLENQGPRDLRDNSPVFKVITEYRLPDAQVFLDETVDRPELARLVDALHAADRLIIRSCEDLADSLPALIALLDRLHAKGVTIRSAKEAVLSGENYARNLAQAQVLFAYFASQHRKLGYQQACQRSLVGRPKKESQAEQAIRLYESKSLTLPQIEKAVGISKSTLYKYLREQHKK
ncbi:MAG: helix-turn-helix domain-containing protein [Hafnia sp.]